ncbi:MAG TPA: fumarylacetoacetate hydrolase family protein [Bryobacteraceae bacterium]|nr:fumarylacetoacetate hydrolase family protein [Bryobacteraceae bacterium]
MKLGQIRWNNDIVAAIIEDGMARPIPDYSMLALIQLSETEGNPLPRVAARLASLHREDAELLIPISPKEIWACGCTYKTSAEFRDAEHGTREGFYAQVYREARPEIFFKGTARFCVGPNRDIGLRADSKFTAPEPELAVVLGKEGRVLGFTIANDVSAWDIERENPLYLPQSKMYTGCCSLGPVIVTEDEIANPYALQMTCTITRGSSLVFSGATSTSNLNRKFEHLTEYLLRANPVPAGSVLLTGTGIIVTEESALGPGDIVTIEVPEIGRLENRAAVIQ